MNPATIENFCIYVPETTIPDKESERVLRMEQAIADKLASIPNVSLVAFSSKIPMDNHDSNTHRLVRPRITIQAQSSIGPIGLKKHACSGAFLDFCYIARSAANKA